jgi:hypothetical protein
MRAFVLEHEGVEPHAMAGDTVIGSDTLEIDAGEVALAFEALHGVPSDTGNRPKT